MTSDEIIKILKRDGWYAVSQNGSHMQFKHPVKKGRTTVPTHRKDLPKGTEESILKQAGLK
jgi:predicted RNA binding protein YcfA (HicA-like mRNA interferase family)